MNKLDIPRKCVLLRDGQEIWMELDDAENVVRLLESDDPPQYLKSEVDGTFFNAADVTGIFTPLQMDERTKLKRGLWKCPQGNWHGKFEFQENGGECDCEVTLGNWVLIFDSFEKWAKSARYRQQRKYNELDKEIGELLKSRADSQRSIAEYKAKLQLPEQEYLELKSRQPWLYPDPKITPDRIKQMEAGMVEKEGKIGVLLQKQELETTEYFKYLASYDLDPENTYPMTPQQVSDFKDFLEKQVW